MSKRRLENEIDELSDEILGDLEPDQRLQLVLSAQANGNEQRIDRLVETCPQYKYMATDRAFANRARLAQRIAHQAVYELHTTYLQYELTQQQHYTWILSYERDERPSGEELDRVLERSYELRMLFIELYTSYYAHRRFATEVLDINPETWLACHPEGSSIFEVVTGAIDDQRKIEFAESYLNARLEEEEVDNGTAEPDQIVPDDNHQVTLEDLVEIRYEVLASVWEDGIAEIP